MNLSFAHVTNELRRARVLEVKEDSLGLWAMTPKLYINIDAIREYPLFKLCIGVTTKHHAPVYKNYVSIEYKYSYNMLEGLYRCIQKDPNVFSAMKVSLCCRWYLESKEDNERGRQIDEIIDSVLR